MYWMKIWDSFDTECSGCSSWKPCFNQYNPIEILYFFWQNNQIQCKFHIEFDGFYHRKYKMLAWLLKDYNGWKFEFTLGRHNGWQNFGFLFGNCDGWKNSDFCLGVMIDEKNLIFIGRA